MPCVLSGLQDFERSLRITDTRYLVVQHKYEVQAATQ